LPNGKIVYTRWDYINRNDTFLQGLWVTNPDGTETAHYYGSYTRSPAMSAEPKPIPDTKKVISTAMAHHSYTAGSIVYIDPAKGEDGEKSLTRVTPETKFPESEGWPSGIYSSPWPINEKIFFAAYSPDMLCRQNTIQDINAYCIVLVDTFGGRELIYINPKMSAFSPIPIQPRKKPFIKLSQLPEDKTIKTGIFVIQNIYEGRYPLPKGEITALRINKIINQPVAKKPERSIVQNEIVKKILGTVKINKDGFVAFNAPAGMPLQLQALDKNGMAVMTMRSFIYLQPGEVSSCIGCHEPRNMTPLPHSKSKFVTQKIVPPTNQDYDTGFSFLKTVQPVLDKNCIKCHGLNKMAGNLNLLGTPCNKVKNK